MRSFDNTVRVRLVAACVSFGGALLVATSLAAAGLSGQEGDVKRKVMYGNTATGGCPGLYKRYVAASGHSAFSATAIDYFYGGDHVCGASFNVRSKGSAEAAAMASCTRALQKYKGAGEQRVTGPCFVYMSK